MLVYVKTMAGQTLNVDVKTSDYIADVKRKLEPDLHLIPSMQQLYFGSRLLEDNITLSSLMGPVGGSLKTGSTLRVIGVRPGTAPMPASRARLLSLYMDKSAQAKDASVKEARTRRAAFEAQRHERQSRAAHLQLARDMGSKYRAAASDLQQQMRAELLKHGYVEDPTQSEQTQLVIRQRDYLIRRAAAWLKKSGGGHGVRTFEFELKEECDLAMHSRTDAHSTTTHYCQSLLKPATSSAYFEAAAERLALSAEEAGQLRRTLASRENEFKALREERDVLQVEAYSWKKDRREVLDRLASLQATVSAMTDELLHYRHQQGKTQTPTYGDVRKMFDALDADGSGTLDEGEVAGLAESLLSPNKALDPRQLATTLSRMRLRDGEVTFSQFYDWYETELTESRRRVRPLYTEVKRLWSKYDKDGSGSLDFEELRQLSTELPELDSGIVDPSNLDIALQQMDSDGSGAVDFDEFYVWYEHQAEKQLLQKQMAEKIEIESKARAEKLAEAALFGLRDSSDEFAPHSASSVASGTSEYESDTEDGSGSDIFDDLNLDDLEAESANTPERKDRWTTLMHGEVDKKAATKSAGSLWKKNVEVKKKAAQAKAEVEAVKTRLETERKSIQGRKKAREAKEKERRKTIVRAKFSAQSLEFCHRCGDSCTKALYQYQNINYCTETCMASENKHLMRELMEGDGLERWRVR